MKIDYARWLPYVLAALRIVTALLFLEHGTQKLFGFPPPARAMPTLMSLIGIQGLIEAAGGLLLAAGLFSRAVAFVLCGDMAVAYFMAHAPRGFFPIANGGDGTILYCFIFLTLWFAGGGAFSIDGAMKRTGAD